MDIASESRADDSIASMLAILNQRRPRVHCIVNEVATVLSANILLVAGAIPSMTNDPYEVSSFVESADALSVNLGMLTDDKRKAIRSATRAAYRTGIPWVLDPTLIERSESRFQFCRELLHYKPTGIRGNRIEIEALLKEEKLDAAEFSAHHKTVIICTGKNDRIVSEKREIEMNDCGHVWMDSVSGMGCALSAFIAAMLTNKGDTFDKITSAVKIFGLVGSQAALSAQGPGTFVSAFLDCLYRKLET